MSTAIVRKYSRQLVAATALTNTINMFLLMDVKSDVIKNAYPT